MKRMKKILAVLLAAIMVMSMGTSVFAEETSYKIEITGVATNSHSFAAYQIFDGDLSGTDSSSYVLSNITWGSGMNTAGENFSSIYNQCHLDNNCLVQQYHVLPKRIGKTAFS